MKTRLAILAIVFPWLATPAFAHRLDEYLQAAKVAVENDHLVLQLRLTPGVEAAGKILAVIDADGDGTMSDAEQRAYAERVRRDLSLDLDGTPLQLRLISSAFPTAEEIKKGLGDILLEFEADVSPGGPSRRLTFENHHQSSIAAYLVNCLEPRDPNIHVIAQNRNYLQSIYQLDFTLAAPQPPPAAATLSGLRQWLDQRGHLSVIETYFCHGVGHILTGYDHLLFVSALVLAATTLWDLVKLVTAFTLAHSITLTLAALNLVHLPERVVEPLISASIVFVALQNIFWPEYSRGRSRLAAAFFFGLFHGLGFAGGLLDVMHQMESGTVFLAILGFSVGVETGHQMVLLPLFGFLKAARHSQRDAVRRACLSMAFQRIGSAAIMVVGVYYLYVALTGNC